MSRRVEGRYPDDDPCRSIYPTLHYPASLPSHMERMVGHAPQWTPARCLDRLFGGALVSSTRMVGCCTRSPP